ncbi:Membrane bound O-acyl transferase family [Teratosphaeria destructans]|uniref:Membrane bound O-acyl transferase family n=1 Tax=Teratosphaeria destructans TaxID=418781 RepID=A0A9W7SXE0_9PEZI|nr:Membrane bound O-acyl transferase family [Teratosphaeria destructans]
MPLPWIQHHPTTFHLLTLPTLALLYLLTLRHLCTLRLQQPPYNRLPPHRPHPSQRLKRNIQVAGTTIAALLLAFPLLAPIQDPLLTTVARTACFFYACKILDLAVMRAATPPTMMTEPASDETPPSVLHDHPQPTRIPVPLPTRPLPYHLHTLHYAYLLTTQMRYHAFSTLHLQPRRPAKPHHTYLPLLLIPILTTIFPNPLTKSLLLLLTIRHTLETLHTTLHPTCRTPLFHAPFAATTLQTFWSTHWQACATPWLLSLAYAPTKRLLTPRLGAKAARAVAVVNTFGLTGVWHAWAVMPAVDEAWAWTLAVQVWAWFVSLGVGCVVENAVFGRREGGWVRWVGTWAYMLVGGGVCWATLEAHDRTGYLEVMGRWMTRAS